MSQNQYFRAGVGCVIFDDNNQILIFSRTDNNDIWQFPQGGMDQGETPEKTLWRELYEETALTNDDFIFYKNYPNWLYYEYPTKIRNSIKDTSCLGQIHCWFFLKIKSDAVVDLSKAPDKEFDGYKWTTFDNFLETTADFKLPVYKKLKTFFTEGFES